jgi:hypothetical protein
MHITKVSTLVVNARMRNWIFVNVETSEPSLWVPSAGSADQKSRSLCHVNSKDDCPAFRGGVTAFGVSPAGGHGRTFDS